MRTRTITETVYTFDELSDAAKAKARDTYNTFLWDSGGANEDMQVIFEREAEARGITDVDNLEYNLYSQGGKPTFSGTLEDTAPDGRTTYVDFKYTSYGWELSSEDEGAMTPDEHEAFEARVLERLRDFSHDLYDLFVDHDDQMSNDAATADASEANEWEYNEAGQII